MSSSTLNEPNSLIFYIKRSGFDELKDISLKL